MQIYVQSKCYEKIILFHNFKCGGTTIREAFKEQNVFDILPNVTHFDMGDHSNTMLSMSTNLWSRLSLLNELTKRWG